jgi:hypothetical protein
MQSDLIIEVCGGKGIDGRQLVIAGAERFYHSNIEYCCERCGHQHGRHWEDMERYDIPESLRYSDLAVLFDRRRVIANGCDDCSCSGCR